MVLHVEFVKHKLQFDLTHTLDEPSQGRPRSRTVASPGQILFSKRSKSGQGFPKSLEKTNSIAKAHPHAHQRSACSKIFSWYR